ncbi:hypothetical protein [Roseobacter sinensis]|uniref:Uncharacterized protein n=1 Tax=Roseobacter sinensis TaxID=2931391 RepID=A0ABT3BBQ0_9RHOB|nr:hypothetical protein [Roseobacter sp. WL0113]MCV3270985.1 hypothetical protein [Roseobacter sp. WL0113]
MFDFVKKTTIAATVSLAALAASGAIAGVNDIDVQAKIEAPQGSNALDLYPTIAEDLERALIERIDALSNDPSDPTLTVKIKRVSLDGDTILPDSAEFNELEGFVSFEGGSRQVVETIRLSAHTDESAVPAGYVAIPPSQDDFYDAMLTAFADRVVEMLPEEDINTGS